MPIIPGLGAAGNLQNEQAGSGGELTYGTLDNQQIGQFGGQLINVPSPFGNIVNQSGILPLKCTLPPGWEEIDGYTEDADEEGQSCTRYFRGPWSQRYLFRDFMLGYRWSDTKDVNGNPVPEGQGFIRTEIPHQHALQPFWYAQRCRFRGEGAIKLDPTAFAALPDGRPINAQGQVVTLKAAPDVDALVQQAADVLGNASYQDIADQLNALGLVGGGTITSAQQVALAVQDLSQLVRLPIIFYFDTATPSTGDAKCAVAEVVYRPLPYEVRTDLEMTRNNLTELNRYVERYDTRAVEALSLPVPNELQFTAGPVEIVNTPIAANGAFIYMQSRELHYRVYGWPDVPEAAIEACLGKVNSTVFDPAAQVTVDLGKFGGGATTVNVGGVGSGFQPGTLLMRLGPKKQRIPRTCRGRVAWNLDWCFHWRPNGWNNFPAPNGQFYPAAFKSTGKPVYDTADFNQLFIPPSPLLYQGPFG